MPATLSATEVRLQITGGDRIGATIPVTCPAFVIGRDPACQLRPNSLEVSRRHALITIDEDEVKILDLASRNGTFLNGQAVSEPTPLLDGDSVAIGPLNFVVSIAAPVDDQPDMRGTASVRSEPPRPREMANAPEVQAAEEDIDEGSIFDDGSPEVDTGATASVSADDLQDMIASYLADRDRAREE